MMNAPNAMGPAPSLTTTQEERFLAAAAHASVFFGFWFVAAVGLYAWKRKESAFVSYHALQAAVAQALFGLGMAVAGVAVGVCWLIAGMVMMSPLAALAFVVPWVVMGLWALGLWAMHAYAAFSAWEGRVWPIPIAAGIARRIQRETRRRFSFLEEGVACGAGPRRAIAAAGAAAGRGSGEGRQLAAGVDALRRFFR